MSPISATTSHTQTWQFSSTTRTLDPALLHRVSSVARRRGARCSSPFAPGHGRERSPFSPPYSVDPGHWWSSSSWARPRSTDAPRQCWGIHAVAGARRPLARHDHRPAEARRCGAPDHPGDRFARRWATTSSAGAGPGGAGAGHRRAGRRRAYAVLHAVAAGSSLDAASLHRSWPPSSTSIPRQSRSRAADAGDGLPASRWLVGTARPRCRSRQRASGTDPEPAAVVARCWCSWR